MKRQTLTDGSGSWFNEDSSTEFREHRTSDGNNLISDATGSQWEHQWLYHTASGRWVLNCWSDYQGSRDTYAEIDEVEAVQWLSMQNKHDANELKELPASVQKAVGAGLAALEL
jgi:hypothetical protein